MHNALTHLTFVMLLVMVVWAASVAITACYDQLYRDPYGEGTDGPDYYRDEYGSWEITRQK